MKDLTHNRVELAINLLQYDAKFQPAIAHLFGSTFVAADQKTAKLVSMAESGQRFNCVTVDGDSYRTDGVLTGGVVQQRPVLDKIELYLKLEKEILQSKNRIASLENQNQQLQANQKLQQQLATELETNDRRLNNLKQRGGEETKLQVLQEEK